jgi:intracellular sulfur oxidation DsrE/DsrF family protein
MFNRRGFLGTLAAGAAVSLTPAWLDAEPTRAQQGGPDAWLDKLKGKHRQLFDMSGHEDGVGLLHVRNWMSTYNSAYSTPDADLNAVITLYGGSTPLAFNDAMWTKYNLGAALKVNDAKTNAPLVRNMFYRPQEGDNFAYGFMDSGMEALQKRGATCILCNNAWTIWSGMLAKGMGMTGEAVKADLAANMLPGVNVVPAMVIAIGKAQEHGLAYMKI